MPVFPITFNWLQGTAHTGCSPGLMHYCTGSCWITVALRKLEKVVIYFTTIQLVSVSTREWNLSKVHLNINSRCWQRDESVCHRQQVTESHAAPRHISEVTYCAFSRAVFGYSPSILSCWDLALKFTALFQSSFSDHIWF